MTRSVLSIFALLVSAAMKRADAFIKGPRVSVVTQLPTIADAGTLAPVTKLSRDRMVARSAAVLLSILLLPSAAHAGNELIGTSVSSILIADSSLLNGFDKSVLINGMISGAAINAAKNIILHPIETVKARLDTGAKTGLFNDAYSGIVPAMAGTRSNYRYRAGF
jgi:hypothetical protein